MLLKVLMRVVSALIIGLIFSLWIIQNTPSVKNMVGSKIISFLEQKWGAHIQADSIKINFFTLSLYFKHGKVTSAQNKDYAWQFEQCKVHASITRLLFTKKVALYLTFNNIKAVTSYKLRQSDLIDHIKNIFATVPPTLKIKVKGITINNIDLMVNLDKSKSMKLQIPGSFAVVNSKYAGGRERGWHGRLEFNDAVLWQNNDGIIHHACGFFSFNKDNGIWNMSSSLRVQSPLLDPATIYTVESICNQTQKSITLKDPKHIIDLTGTFTESAYWGVKGNFPVTLMTKIVRYMRDGLQQTQISLWPMAEGKCAVDLTFVPKKSGYAIAGSTVITDFKAANIALQKVSLIFAGNNDERTYSNVDIIRSPQAQLTGTFYWDWFKNNGSLTITNTASIALPLDRASNNPLMVIPANDLSCSIGFDLDGSLKGTYRCALTNNTTNRRYSYKGIFMLRDKEVVVKGLTSKGKYVLKAVLNPHMHLTKWRYVLKHKDIVNLYASSADPMKLEGTVRWAFIRSFLDDGFKRFIFNNNCTFALMLNQHDLENLYGTFHLSEGRFFIPDYHNLIQKIEFKLHVHLKAKRMFFDDIYIGFSKGNVTCPRASLTLKDDYSIGMVHAPLTINNLFVNWHRDFYGFVYGNLLFNKLPSDMPKLSGTVVLKQSLLKNALFAEEKNNSFYGPMGGVMPLSSLPLGLDIKLMTEKPIKAKTPSIEALASLNMVLHNVPNKGLYSSPYITGLINLSNGELKFFKHRLRIEYGKIQFVSNNMHDPLVDLVAKNRIGKYFITLQITGSQQKPTILLESTPDLTEEQIIGLLFTGSEDVSLQAALPTMILRNLGSLIFDNKKHVKNSSWVDKLNKTLQYVQITPDFDESGITGAIKGSISVNLNDQLRAQIQKNLDLQKDFSSQLTDFSAQVEYMLSDDINLKVVKDQRGELGSEVEMRLKLG